MQWTDTELMKTSRKKTDEIENCLAGACKIEINRTEVLVENDNAGKAVSTINEQRVFSKKMTIFNFNHTIHIWCSYRIFNYNYYYYFPFIN